MKEIKIGDYIRTQNGLIGKLEEINKEPTDETITYIVTDNFLGIIDEIKKYSPNKLDLLEIGDLIRFKELRIFTYNFGTSFYNNYISEIHSKEELENIKKEIKSKKIRLLGIITKEQIKDIEYRLEK